MIITKLAGGIGNQMFQYAAGLILSEVHGTSLKMDINFLLDKSRRYYRYVHRDYALDMYRIRGTVATVKEVSQFTVPRKGNKYLYHLKRRIRREHNVFRDSSVQTADAFLKIPSEAYLDGYWQNYGYYLGHEELIRKEFVFSGELPLHSLPVSNAIKNADAVAVVVRRGDFVGHPELDILRPGFYAEGMEMMVRRFPAVRFFVFSEDISWCRQNINSFPDRVSFVSEEHTGPNGEFYLQLISSCHHFIIPNSTFAWWGAWLGKHPEKTVIAPEKWYRTQKDITNPILPPDWIAI